MIVNTKFEFCVDSPDFTIPIGAIHDDTTDLDYIKSIEEFFDNRKLTTLELGCSGGRVVKDLVDRGHDAYGLEGTPFPMALKRPAWVELYKKRLFTCDLSKPFELLNDDGENMTFDAISHWEFLEHLPPSSLDYFHARLYVHLKDDGSIFSGYSPWGPTTNRDRFPEGDHRKTIAMDVVHHQSCFWREEWEELYWNKFFNCHDYPLEGKLREDGNEELQVFSEYIHLTKKNTPEVLNLALETIRDYESLPCWNKEGSNG